jgi:regulatory protein
MQEKRRKRPRRITPEYLERAALHHLERYASSSENLRRVLTRRVWKAARLAEDGHAVDEEQAAAWIEAVVEKLQRSGLLDDRAYAEGRVVALRRQGESARGIAMKLGAKGVPRDTVDAALELDEPENDDVAAAVAYARRRRLGPWRKPDERDERRDRDLAALARKGYRLELCRRVIEAHDIAAAEDIARGEE